MVHALTLFLEKVFIQAAALPGLNELKLNRADLSTFDRQIVKTFFIRHFDADILAHRGISRKRSYAE